MKQLPSYLWIVAGLILLMPLVAVSAQDDRAESDDYSIQVSDGTTLTITIHNDATEYHLPDDILANYSQIDTLIINSTPQFTRLPQSIVDMTNLEQLIWSSGVAFTLGSRGDAEVVLPPELVKLDNLYWIALDVKMRNLPDFLRDMPALTGLNLHNNGFSEFPAVIAELPYLETLNLASSSPLILPDEIASDNLQSVALSDLGLTTFPQFLLNQPDLEYIMMENNSITELPPGIGSLSSLRLLDLVNNDLTALPDEIVNLESISTINLSNNNLTALPENIGDSSGMRHLNVSGNQITELPESIAGLSTNESVDVRYNQLSSLPESLLELDDLCFLDPGNNDNLRLDSSFANKFSGCTYNLNGIVVEGIDIETVTGEAILPLANIAIIVLLVIIFVFAAVATYEKRRRRSQSKRKTSS